ncbi:MAG: hypothetical protein QXQ70_09980 [Candidatus Caldarchaeum sp.]
MKKSYVYVEYITGESELYDLNEDPYQLKKLSSTADRRFLDWLSAWLDKLVDCSGESCRTGESTPPPLSSISATTEHGQTTAPAHA